MKKVVVGFFKCMFMFCALMALASSILEIVHPWEGRQAAKEHAQGYFPLAVGGSSVGYEIKSRNYALMPISVAAPKMLFVSKSENGAFKTKVEISSFWLFGAIIVYGWYLIIKFVQHKMRTKTLPGGGATRT